MEVLITGSSGYIGSFLTSQSFFSEDVKINFVGIDQSTKFNHMKQIYQGSFCDPHLISKVFQENPGISHVIHLAALKSAPESLEKINLYYQTNVQCTLNFIEELCSKKIKKFVFASSAAVYDYSTPPHNNRLSEESKLGTSSPYGVFKRLIEAEISRFAEVSNSTHFQSVRIFNPVGLNPQSHWSSRADLLSKIANCIKNNTVLEIRGDNFQSVDGTAVRDFIPIEDLVIGLMKLTTSTSKKQNHEIYNLGTGRETSILGLVEKVNETLQAYNKKLRYSMVNPITTDIRGYAADISKLTKLLEWTPTTSLDSTLKRFFDMVVQNDK